MQKKKMEQKRKFILITTLCLLLLASNAKAEMYTIKIGTNYNSLFNLCYGDTLKFVGDSVNPNVYGAVQGYVYNNQTSSYDNFYVVSDTNMATSYEHILVPGDTAYFYNLGTFHPLTDGHLFFNCLSTSIEKITFKTNQSFFPNPFSEQTVLQTNDILQQSTLTLYNVFGEQVKQQTNIFGKTIVLYRDNLTSGIYFFRLTQGSKIISENKLVIIN
jgi:hypothetical protein